MFKYFIGLEVTSCTPYTESYVIYKAHFLTFYILANKMH